MFHFLYLLEIQCRGTCTYGMQVQCVCVRACVVGLYIFVFIQLC